MDKHEEEKPGNMGFENSPAVAAECLAPSNQNNSANNLQDIPLDDDDKSCGPTVSVSATTSPTEATTPGFLASLEPTSPAVSEVSISDEGDDENGDCDDVLFRTRFDAQRDCWVCNCRDCECCRRCVKRHFTLSEVVCYQ